MYKSPICSVLGHVDTGKTKLLDNFRSTNVQGHEVAGITQQIGATFFTQDKLITLTKSLLKDKIQVPGLLIMDTPGHECFSNMRIRGGSICDMAVLVVDIMHGIEPQTLESINILKKTKTPYIVALNKLDLIYGWKTNTKIMKDNLKEQDQDSLSNFEERVDQIKLQFAENGLNTELYYKNKNPKEFSSLVPCSAITGEGVPDLIYVLIGLVQKFMIKKITYQDKVSASILEVRQLDGVGTVLDVILSNGILKVNDNILISTLNGTVRTQIKRLYTPKPQKEIRVKGELDQHQEIHASIGAKIFAENLHNTIAGTNVFVINDIEEEKIQKLENYLNDQISHIQNYKKDIGIYIQTTSIGSIEAFSNFLDQNKIPISGMNIGPINKKDVIKIAPMVEKDKRYAVILAFDVQIHPNVKKIAEEVGVKIFEDTTIYRLYEQYKKFLDDLDNQELEEKKRQSKKDLIYPCKIKIIPKYVFRKDNPIICGVQVLDGALKVGTKLIVKKDSKKIHIGKVLTIQYNKKPVEVGKEGDEVCIKIEPDNKLIQYGKQFDSSDFIYSDINQKNIDALKLFKDDCPVNEDNIERLCKEITK
jgi:translation initiation factor 5B